MGDLDLESNVSRTEAFGLCGCDCATIVVSVVGVTGAAVDRGGVGAVATLVTGAGGAGAAAVTGNDDGLKAALTGTTDAEGGGGVECVGPIFGGGG